MKYPKNNLNFIELIMSEREQFLVNANLSIHPIFSQNHYNVPKFIYLIYL